MHDVYWHPHVDKENTKHYDYSGANSVNMPFSRVSIYCVMFQGCYTLRTTEMSSKAVTHLYYV